MTKVVLSGTELFDLWLEGYRDYERLKERPDIYKGAVPLKEKAFASTTTYRVYKSGWKAAKLEDTE